MNILFADQIEPIDQLWKEVENLPKCERIGCKVKVKLNDLTEKFAYFYPDMMIWISDYGKQPSYFWDCQTKEPLFNVTHWNYLKKEGDK